MTSRKSQVAQSEPGRIDLFGNTNRRIPVNLTHVLPDGSRLTDQANEHLLRTILGIIDASQPRLTGTSFAPVIRVLYVLIQWMFSRSIYRFSSLRKHHYREFLLDSSQGLDVCINATPRLYEHLNTLVAMPNSERKKLLIGEVFAGAGIPHTYVPRLKRTRSLAHAFIDGGAKALAKAPQVPLVRRVAWTTLRTRVTVIQRLWEFRDSLADPAQEEPFHDDVLNEVRRLGLPSVVVDNYLGRSTTTILAGSRPTPGRSGRRV